MSSQPGFDHPLKENYILNNINKFLEDADSLETRTLHMRMVLPIGLMDCDRFSTHERLHLVDIIFA